MVLVLAQLALAVFKSLSLRCLQLGCDGDIASVAGAVSILLLIRFGRDRQYRSPSSIDESASPNVKESTDMVLINAILSTIQGDQKLKEDACLTIQCAWRCRVARMTCALYLEGHLNNSFFDSNGNLNLLALVSAVRIQRCWQRHRHMLLMKRRNELADANKCKVRWVISFNSFHTFHQNPNLDLTHHMNYLPLFTIRRESGRTTTKLFTEVYDPHVTADNKENVVENSSHCN